MNAVKQKEALSLDQLLPNAGDSVFRLTRMAMLRALEIHGGKPPLVEFSLTDKPTTIALREIAQGKIVFKDSPPEEKKLHEIADVEVPDKHAAAEHEIENIVGEVGE